MKKILTLEFHANLFNVLGSLGYAIANIYTSTQTHLSTEFSNGMYLILSVVYVLDALLWMGDWIYNKRYIKGKKIDFFDTGSGFWAEVYNIVGSLFTVAAAAVIYIRGPTIDITDENYLLTMTITIATLNSIGCFVYLQDAFFYYADWREDSYLYKTRWYSDIYFWAAVLCIIPALGYFISSIYGSIGVLMVLSNANEIRQTRKELMGVRRLVLMINSVCDFVYIVDAVIYFVGWYIDEFVESKEEKKSETKHLITISHPSIDS
eukprot:TRINITY_DN205_c0_g1_i1.p1 TRINITY_DN205_c0_g1~~TRINITY_DN205_c0_g1_i1.p1  ORF type:complete len:302 (+),score=51.67 TRINITY_DN205_c0_g1_i1:115-906(+)